MKTRFKVSVPKVLQSGLEPIAVIVAAVSVPNPNAGPAPGFREVMNEARAGKALPSRRLTLSYVLLGHEERDALWRLSRDMKASPAIGDFHMSDWCAGAPPLLRTGSIDVDTGLPVGADESRGLEYLFGERARGVSWLSGESLWVLSQNFAPPALAALAKWREEHAPNERSIHAPSWGVMTAVRKLAIAAGSPDPGIGDSAAKGASS